MPKVVLADPVAADDTPHKVLGGGLGPYSYQLISEPGQLTQFGAFIEHLPPGSRSGFRHWHQTEDEMVYVLTGEVVLVEDGETLLHPGQAACWPAGSPVAHYLANRSDRAASYLVVGSRYVVDRIHYPDHDLVTEKDGPARVYLHADGRPREGVT